MVKDGEKSGVGDLVVDAKVYDELVARGKSLENERTEPCKGIGSL